MSATIDATHPATCSDAPVSLPSVTRNKLQEFRQRRHLLMLLRGGSLGLLVVVLVLLSAIVIDAWFPHSASRWIGSLLVYGSTLLALAWLWFSFHARQGDLKTDARRIERLDPRLRHCLLSAVELGESESTVGDSQAFRTQLQNHVANLLSGVDMQQLLPWSRARRRVRRVCVALAGVAVLCLIPQLHFTQRLARILLPAADIGRISRIAISIERPAPQSKVVPRDDMVAITARVDGPTPEALVLETRTAIGIRPDIAMIRLPESINSQARFEGLITMQAEPVEYRITGANASTAWYKLTPKARPTVVEFTKQIFPPDYAHSAASHACDDHGNLEVLAGSRIELRLKVDQATQIHELQWQGDTHTLALQRDLPTNQLVGNFLAEKSAAFKVHLQSLDTGFTNTFSPSYDLTVLDDLPPEVTWLRRENSVTVASTEQILPLAYAIDDELPLASLEVTTRINDSEWQTDAQLTVVSFDIGTNHRRRRIEQSWVFDLLPHDLKPGDQLEIRLVATDRKGQPAESPILKVVISPISLAIEPTTAEMLRRELAESLEDLHLKVAAANQEFDVLHQVKTGAQPELQIAQLQQLLSATSTELRDRASHSLDLLQRAAADPGDMAISHALADVGGILATLKTTATDVLSRHSPLLPGDNSGRQQNWGALQQTIAATQQQTKELSEHVQVLTTLDVTTRQAHQFFQLAEAERALAESTQTGELSIEQLNRRQAVLTQQLRESYQSLVDAIPFVRAGSQQSLQLHAALLSQQVDLAEQLKLFSDREVGVARVAQSVAQLLDRVRLPSQLDASLLGALRSAERRLAEMAADVTPPLERLADDLAQPVESDGALLRATQHLSDRRTVERSAAHGDRLFAADLGAGQRALEKIVTQLTKSTQDQPQQIRQVAQAIGTLQAVHSVEQIDGLLSELMKAERWQDETSRQLLSPRLWESLSNRLGIATRQLQRVKVPTSIIDNLQTITQNTDFHSVGLEMVGRLLGDELSDSAIHDLEQIQTSLSNVRKQLSKQAELARNQLRRYAPTVAELARTAAQETQHVEEHSQQLAESIERQEVPDISIRFAQLANQTHSLSQPLESLRDSLVDQADSQDLLDQQQIQIAKQADAALEIVERIDKKLKNSLADVSLQATPSTQAQALKEAAKNQAQSASTLEQLAEFFERQATQTAGPIAANVSTLSLEELARQAMPSAPAQQPSKNRGAEVQAEYQQAEELAQLAAQDPQSVLRQLEEELNTNAPMAIEMSQIAKQSAEHALHELESAARRQQLLANELEKSDPRFEARKILLVHDLQTIREEAQQMLTTVGQEAKWTAGASKSESQEQRIVNTDENLQAALEATRNIGMQLPFDHLHSLAAELKRQLEAAAGELQDVSQELSKHSFEEIHQNGADLNNRRREMRDRQRRIQQQSVRDAQNLERSQQQRLRRAEEVLLQSEQRLQQIAAQSQVVQEQLQKDGSHGDAAVRMAELNRKLALAQESVSSNQQLKDAMHSRLNDSKAALQSINQRGLSQLASANPTAELSASLAKQAAEMNQSMSQRLESWERQKNAKIQAAFEHLQTDEVRQSDLRGTVDSAAQDLARAARHEFRLKNPTVGQRLQLAAESTQAVADHDLQQASAQIAAAMQDAQSNGSHAGQASAAVTAATRTAVQAAASQIENAAQGVRNLLAETNSSPSGAAAPETTVADSAAQTPSSLDAQQKAQLLDELDRQISADLNLGAKEDNAQPAPSGGEPSEMTAPGTLSDAAKQLAKSMSQGRQPPPESSENTDIGMATESQMANVNPQPPVAVQLIEIERGNSRWGLLREQSAEALLETGRETFSPRFRKQIEAYFRELAERGQPRE